MFYRGRIGSLVGLFVAGICFAEAPRYQWKDGQEFVYQVEIVADLPAEVETMTGHAVYTVKSAADPLKISYRGGLGKVTKRKPGAGSSRPSAFGPFGPRGFAPPPPFSPFARRSNPFQGLEQTTNEVSLTARGVILALKGTSHLPYLLGNLSLLPFETLPESDQQAWSVESGVLITERNDQSSGHPFDPFGGDPFFAGRFGRGSRQPEKTTTGSRETRYRLVEQNENLATYEKTFVMTSPGGDVRLKVEGKGTWTFHRQLNVPESLTYQQDLHIKDGNVAVVVPVKINYRRLSSEEWAKIERDRLAAIEERKAEMARQAAEAKAKADAPIEGAERTAVLTSLDMGEDARRLATLKMLSSKTPREDAGLAAAIRPHIDAADEATRSAAKAALAAFAPQFKRVYELNRRYRDRKEVAERGLWVAYDTPLPIGLIVAANKNHYEQKYYPAEVVSVASDGLVKVRYFGGGRWTEDRLREDMYLAPPDVEQPNLDEAQMAEYLAHVALVRESLGKSPEEVTANEVLNRAYRDNKEPLPKTGAPIPPKVKLPKFTVLAARKEDGKWYQCHVSSELPDGRVAVRFSGGHWDSKLAREQLRFPPTEVKPPNLPPILLASKGAPGFRTWTDSGGKFTVIARYVSSDGESVVIHRQSDGKVFPVPLARLSEPDRQYVAAMNRAADDNPFDP